MGDIFAAPAIDDVYEACDVVDDSTDEDADADADVDVDFDVDVDVDAAIGL